jgi:uncharacterized protein (TIGR02757 family)
MKPQFRGHMTKLGPRSEFRIVSPIWKRAAIVGPALERLLAETDARERRQGDPVELVHAYRHPLDVEVAGLLCAALAYGRVDLFKPRLSALLAALDPSPSRIAREAPPAELLRRASGFAYRMTGPKDVAALLFGAGRIQRAHGSIGSFFAAAMRERGSVREAIGALVDELYAPDFTPLLGQPGPTRRLKHLLPHPSRGSACKRLNLFLRWMIRGPDGVDFGLWDVPESALVVPLDTHVHRIGRFIGLTRRRDLSWRTAEEVTRRLRTLDRDDPVRFDFALSHLGISGECASRRDARRCANCSLKPICRFWT